MAAVDKTLFPEVELQKTGSSAPVSALTGGFSDAGKDTPVWWKRIAQHWGHQFMAGAAESKGALEDFAVGATRGEPGVMSLLRGIGLPREWIDAVSPVKLGAMPDAKTFGQEFQAKETSFPERETDPNAVVEHIGKGLKGAGRTIMSPWGGPMKPATILATGYGAGAMGDVARTTGVGINRGLNYITGSEDDPTQGIIPSALEFGGNLAGGYLGTVKASAVTEGAKGLWRGGKTVGGSVGDVGRTVVGTEDVAKYATTPGKAFASARAQKREGDARGLLDIFFNEYKVFGADQKNMMTSLVASRLSSALQDDPNLQKSMQDFLEANNIVAAGSKYSPQELAAMFDTAQRTANPALAAVVLERKERPLGVGGGAKVAKREGTLRTALKNIFGGTKEEMAGGADDIDNAFNEFRGAQEAKIAGVKVQEDILKGDFANLNATDLSMQGKAVKSAYEAEKSVGKNTVDTLYGQARSLGDRHGPVFELQDVMAKADAILGEAQSNLGGGAGTIARRLKDYLTPENGIKFTKEGGISLTEPLLYSQADDVGKALDTAISDARRVGDGVKERSLTQLKKTLNEQIYAKARELDPQLADARQKADAFFANEYAPRFKEGVVVDKESARARPGMDQYKDVDLLRQYIPESGPVDESTLKKFDDVFGGDYRGGARREEMYAHMGQYVENLYRQKVLQREAFDLVNHEKFMSNMDPVFSRVPGLKDKLDSAATDMITLQGQRRAIEDNAKYLMGRDAPLTKVVGPDEARILYAKALSDPRRMSKLIAEMPGMQKPMLREAFNLGQPVNPDGSLDAERLRKVLYAGRAEDRGDSISGLQTLARAAYGRDQGDVYFKKLESLLTLVERENLTAGRYMRPRADELGSDPITALSGQSPQSYISQIYAFGSGRVNPAYLVATPISRFVAKMLGNKIAEAEEKLLHTPDGVNVLLELRDKKPGEQISKKSRELLEGASKGSVALFDRLFNTEDFNQIQLLSAQRAAVNQAQQENKRSKQP